jgi:hypothetical protein
MTYRFKDPQKLVDKILDKLYEESYEFENFWESLGTRYQNEIEKMITDTIKENTERVEL